VIDVGDDGDVANWLEHFSLTWENNLLKYFWLSKQAYNFTSGNRYFQYKNKQNGKKSPFSADSRSRIGEKTREEKYMRTFQSHFAFLAMGLFFLTGCAMSPAVPSYPEKGPAVAVEPPFPPTPAPPAEAAAFRESAAGMKAFSWDLHKLGGVYPDADNQVRRALAEIGGQLGRYGAAGNSPMRIEVINHSRPAAVVFPGGGIGLTRGLLLLLQDEAQVAAVIAHQLGHLRAGHLQRAMAGEDLAPGFEALAGLAENKSYVGGYGADVAAALKAVKALQEWEFTADEEAQADRLALTLLRDAGYSPQAMAQAMKVLEAAGKGGFPPPERGLGWQFHPYSAARERQGMDSSANVAPSLAASPGPVTPPPWRQRLTEEAGGYLIYEQALQAERRNDSRAAVTGYLEAASVLPEEPLILGRLGLAYLQEEDIRSARFYLEQALRVDPEHHASLLGLGFVHLANGDYPAARRRLETAMALLPTLQGTFLLAETCAGEGDTERARGLFAQVVQADGDGRFGRAAAKRLQGFTGN